MFSIHTKLFLALKKVRIIKIIPPQVPFTQEAPSFIKISDSHPPSPPKPVGEGNLPPIHQPPSTPYCYLENPGHSWGINSAKPL